MNLFAILTELPQILLPAPVSVRESTELCSSTRSLLQRLQSVQTQALPRAPLLALPVPFFFFFFLAIRLLFPAQGTFFSCQMGSWIQPFVCSCPLHPACFSFWETASPYLDPRGKLICSILHGANPTSRVEIPFRGAAAPPPWELQPQAPLCIHTTTSPTSPEGPCLMFQLSNEE